MRLLTGERNLPNQPFTQKELDAEIAIVRAENRTRRREEMKHYKHLEETWEKNGETITTTAIEGMPGHLGDILNGHLKMFQYGWTLKSRKSTPFTKAEIEKTLR